MNGKEKIELCLKLLMNYDFEEHKKKFPETCSVIGSKQLFNSGWVTGYKQRLEIEEAKKRGEKEKSRIPNKPIRKNK